MISCAQACMMRASGQSTEAMLSANGGICDRCGNSGCSLIVLGEGYSFCQSCTVLQPHCPHGVQSNAECDFGASVVPPSLQVLPVTLPPQPVSVQQSWDNHFAACGGQDGDRVLLDYTEDSVIIVYDQTSGGQTVFSGLAGVRDCFTGPFCLLVRHK